MFLKYLCAIPSIVAQSFFCYLVASNTSASNNLNCSNLTDGREVVVVEKNYGDNRKLLLSIPERYSIDTCKDEIELETKKLSSLCKYFTVTKLFYKKITINSCSKYYSNTVSKIKGYRTTFVRNPMRTTLCILHLAIQLHIYLNTIALSYTVDPSSILEANQQNTLQERRVLIPFNTTTSDGYEKLSADISGLSDDIGDLGDDVNDIGDDINDLGGDVIDLGEKYGSQIVLALMYSSVFSGVSLCFSCFCWGCMWRRLCKIDEKSDAIVHATSFKLNKNNKEMKEIKDNLLGVNTL